MRKKFPRRVATLEPFMRHYVTRFLGDSTPWAEAHGYADVFFLHPTVNESFKNFLELEGGHCFRQSSYRVLLFVNIYIKILKIIWFEFLAVCKQWEFDMDLILQPRQGVALLKTGVETTILLSAAYY